MNVSVESLEMLINRLSNIEESLSKVGKFPEGVCPCWINSISFHDNGNLKEVKFFAKSRSTCMLCYPKD
jgi:hypothetical protein